MCRRSNDNGVILGSVSGSTHSQAIGRARPTVSRLGSAAVVQAAVARRRLERLDDEYRSFVARRGDLNAYEVSEFLDAWQDRYHAAGVELIAVCGGDECFGVPARTEVTSVPLPLIPLWVLAFAAGLLSVQAPSYRRARPRVTLVRRRAAMVCTCAPSAPPVAA